MRRYLLPILILIAIVFQQCDSQLDPQPTLRGIADEEKNLAARWADVTLRTIQLSYPNSPTFTSRNLGYIGVTMYESVVHGSATHKSLAGQLSALASLPMPATGLEYCWELALNAGQASILRLLYPHTTKPHLIDSMEQAIAGQFAHLDPGVNQRSIEFGKAVAEAIFEWSKGDGGHEGHYYHFDAEYQVPVGEGHWTPPFFGQSASMLPLHPHWGRNRTFVANNALLPVPQKASYSASRTSDYYQLFMEVYNKQKLLTQEQRRIAAWWADDPTQSASPPGHSYNLTTIAVTTARSDIFSAAEAYAKVGIAVADAFICCWKAKYTYHSQRPYTYIQAHIDENYKQFWPEPPFPAFPSGHATQSASAAIALMSIFGEHFPLIDNTYQYRQADFQNIPYRTRAFSNIWETAEECARSRFLGGIHTREDNEQGQRQGVKIGENVVALKWSR